jgi:sugar phosphate isomerase/epimerase
VIINGIEQGLCLYSYTQQLIERQEFDLEQIFEAMNRFGVSKYEITGPQSFNAYPRPSAAEIDRVLTLSEKYGLEPFGYGAYVDWGTVSGRSPEPEDVLFYLTADLITARDLGCATMRGSELPLHLLPRIAELAEKFGVNVGYEVHAPHQPSDAKVQELMETFDAVGSDRLGFIPDFGCFIERPAEPALRRFEAKGASRENLDYIIANRHSGMSPEDLEAELNAKGAGLGEKMAISELFGYLSFGPADIEGFKTIIRRSHYFHSKFYHVTADLVEPQIPLQALLDAIVDSGFSGVLLSEYEGHAFAADDADEQLDRHYRLEQAILQDTRHS